MAKGQPIWSALLSAWREKRFAEACCRKLLKTYTAIAAEHPHLSRSELYERVVAAHTGRETAAVAGLLQGAQESFATWPMSRDLIFRDVAHFLAMSEYLAAHEESRWLNSDLKPVVNRLIPHDL